MAGTRTQCLLFVMHERKLDVGKSAAFIDRSKVSGFALLPHDLEASSVQFRELLAENGFPVLSNDQDFTSLTSTENSSNVEVIEILLDEKEQTKGEAFSSDVSCSEEYRSVAQNCFVNAGNIEIVSLLGIGASHKQKGDPRTICCAVDEQNMKVFERFIRCKVDISLRHPEGGTILHLAVKRGHEMLVEVLLTHGADVNVQRHDGATALHIATLRGLTTIVENLLQHRASPNVETSSGLFIGSTPLHFAVRRGHPEITELLLTHGAYVDAEDFENRTSLSLAVEWQYLEAVEIILNHRLDVIQETSMEALCHAVHTRKIEFSQMVKLRFEHALMGRSENAYNRNLLHDVISVNSQAIVEHLSKFGDGTNSLTVDNHLSLERVTLATAAGLKEEDVMKAFLEYSTDATIRLNWQNVKNDRLDNIKLLIKHGARYETFNEFGRSLLHIACKDGSSDIVETLLRHGMDPYFLSPCEEEVPLFVAIRYGRPVVVKTFLEFGIPTEFRNSSGQTALHVAASLNKPQVVEILLDYGADVHIRCNEKTPLSIAAEAGFVPVIKVLLNFGARLDPCDRQDLDGFHFAVGKVKDSSIAQTIVTYSFSDLKNKIDALRETLRSKPCRGTSFEQKFCCVILSDFLKKIKCVERVADVRLSVERSLNEGIGLGGMLWRKLNTELRFLKDRCEEGMKMKEQTLRDSDVSFYDLLVEDVDVIVDYLRKDSTIIELLRSNELRNKFPTYKDIIRSQLEKAIKRRALIERGTKECAFLCGHLSVGQFLSLPFNIAQKILVHLSNKDIGCLINACSRKGHCLGKAKH